MCDELVSIIVPVYNGEKYIQRCVTCIQAQTYTKLEVIFVDDGSKDASGAMLDEIANKDYRIRVIHKENGGLCSARNAGIKNATGTYVYFFDVDDEITPDLIADNVVLARENHADVVMFGFWYKLVEQNVERRNPARNLFIGSGEEYFRQELVSTVEREIFNAPWNKLIRLDFLRESGLLFDERYPIYEDIIFNATLMRLARKVVVNPQTYYKYYVRTSGTLITRFYEGYFDSVTQFYINAMEYCGQFENHEQQKRTLTKVYVVHVYTHLKQISTNKDLSKQRKKELIARICESPYFLEALDFMFLIGRKKYIRHLIKKKRVSQIIMVYQGLAWIQAHELVGRML